MKLISAKTREAAWLQAVEHLLLQDKGTEYNLIIEVEEPGGANAHSKYIRHAVDSLISDAINLFNEKKDSIKKSEELPVYPINTVAETIFPANIYKRLKDLEKVQDEYLNDTLGNIKSYKGNSINLLAIWL